MNDIIFNIFNSYAFIYGVMPLLGAILCMLCNSMNAKDHHIPLTFEEKWKKDMFEVTNFVTIWLIIMALMQAYKAFLLNIWGIK